MSCARYRSLISRYLDDELTLRERDMLMAHLIKCRTCAATLARYRGIETSFRKLPETKPSSTVRDNVLGTFNQGNTSRSPRFAWRLAIWRFAFPDISLLNGRISVGVLPTIFIIALAGLLALYASQIGLVSTGKKIALEPTISTPLTPIGLEENGGAASYTPVSRDLHIAVVLEQMLRESDAARPIRLPVPAYIPAGMRLERFSLNPGNPTAATGDVEMAFRAQDGKMVSIRHGAGTMLAAPESAKRILVGGHEWWVQQHPASSRDSAQSYIIFTKQNDEVVVLDAVLPLDELMRIAESIQWAEEEK